VAREEYVRPPLVAAEAPSRSAARWRFRVVGALLLLAVGLVMAWLVIRLSGVTGGENPGIGGIAQPRSGILSSALVPRG
jgi:hypothetical protein